MSIFTNVRNAFARTKALKPIYDRDDYSASVQAAIEYAFYRQLYKPLLDVLAQSADIRESAKADLIVRALKDRRILYEGQTFTGTFNAALSRQLRALGAVFDKERKAYILPLSRLPVEVKTAISEGKLFAEEQLRTINATLDKIGHAPAIHFEGSLDRVIADLSKQFAATTLDLSVPAALTDEIVDRIKTEYTDNMDLYIQNWQEEAIQRLREKVQAQALDGFRAESMEKMIRSEYGVTQNKARFLARQETSLLVSKYRQARYQEAGMEEYRWSTSNDERVRADHRALNRRVFRWDQPPIVDTATGRTGHPGEDFGCRCIAIPIVRLR